ncbi:MAG: hypothetical protein M5U25_13275 [Planctomycetota bacterium]|nr:hypothetical protein [Planctomycetota bacterium]
MPNEAFERKPQSFGGCAIWVAVGLIGLAALWAFRETISGWWFLGGLFLYVVVTLALYQTAKDNKRWNRLMEKYGDRQAVERIMKHVYWEGMTDEMLRDALGIPIPWTKADSRARGPRHGSTIRMERTASNSASR